MKTTHSQRRYNTRPRKRTRTSTYSTNMATFTSLPYITLFLLILISICSICSISNVSNVSFFTNAKEIEPTKEWQVIAEGDTIPAGLHVKMDLETGTKWAKLMDDDDDDDGDVGDDVKSDDTHVNVNVNDVEMNSASSSALSSSSVNTNSNDNGNDTNNNNDINSKPTTNEEVKITHLENTKVDPKISAQITDQFLKQAQAEDQRKANMIQSISSLNDFQNGDTVDGAEEKDYDAMYRALMSLPEEDIQRLNVPIHPLLGTGTTDDKDNGDNDDNSDNDEKLEHFITQIKQIWNQRQGELKKMEEEYMANIPTIIQDRISSLEDYISSPIHHLKNVLGIQNVNGNGNGNANGNENDKDEDEVMSIMDVLEDLEYHLMDIDMSRDFKYMGGWPILVSLTTDDIHGLDHVIQDVIAAQNWTTVTANSASTSANSASISNLALPEEDQIYIQQLKDAIWQVQLYASWCIGTAVKNVEEFHPWALEDLSDLLQYQPITTSTMANTNANATSTEPASTSTVNVLSILLSKLQKTIHTNDHNLHESKPWLKMKQKDLYALGALLRGNKEAISYFNSNNGPSTLSDFFHGIINNSNGNNGSDDNLVLKDMTVVRLLLRIMMLGVDLVTESAMMVVESGSASSSSSTTTSHAGNMAKDLLSSLTNEKWCSMPIKILSNTSPNVQRQALEAITHLASHCNYDSEHINAIEFTNDPDVQDLLKNVYAKVLV